MVYQNAEERVRFIRSSALPGTELQVVYESRRSWRGFNERYAFVVWRKAGARVRYRGSGHSIEDGTVALREPGEAYSSIEVTKPAHFKVLFVEVPVLLNAAHDLGHAGALHFPPVAFTNPELFAVLWRLYTAIEESASELEQQCLFANAVAGVVRHAERPRTFAKLKNGKLAVACAKAYLRKHCSERISLHELAGISGLSRFGLVHAFTREVGLSPHAYQVHVRIEQARMLLKQGISPADVATTMGFADQSHFTRHFKRIMQVTPSQYARPAVDSTLHPCGRSVGRRDRLASGLQPAP